MLNQVSVTTVTYSKEHTHKPIKLINIQISKSTPKLRDSRALNAQNIYLSTTRNLKFKINKKRIPGRKFLELHDQLLVSSDLFHLLNQRTNQNQNQI